MLKMNKKLGNKITKVLKIDLELFTLKTRNGQVWGI